MKLEELKKAWENITRPAVYSSKPRIQIGDLEPVIPIMAERRIPPKTDFSKGVFGNTGLDLDQAVLQGLVERGKLIQVVYETDDGGPHNEGTKTIKTYVYLEQLRNFGRPSGSHTFWEPLITTEERLIPSIVTFPNGVIRYWQLIGDADPQEMERIKMHEAIESGNLKGF